MAETPGGPFGPLQGVRTQLHPLPLLTSACSIPRGKSQLAHRATSLLRVDWPLRWPGPHPQEVKLPGWRCWRCGVWPGRHEYQSPRMPSGPGSSASPQVPTSRSLGSLEGCSPDTRDFDGWGVSSAGQTPAQVRPGSHAHYAWITALQ